MPGFRRRELPRVLDEQIKSMIRGHELIIDILSTPGLADMIDELRDAEFRNSIAEDPMPEMRKRNVRLPETGAYVTIRDLMMGWEIEFQVLEKDTLYIFGFSSMHGFFSK